MIPPAVDYTVRQKKFFNEIKPIIQTLVNSRQGETQTLSKEKFRLIMKEIQEINLDSFSEPKKKSRPRKKKVKELSLNDTSTQINLGHSPKQYSKNQNVRQLQIQITEKLMHSRKQKFQDIKEMKNTQEGFSIYEKTSPQSVKKDDSSPHQEADLRTKIAKTTTDFFIRTGLKKENNNTKHQLPLIEEKITLIPEKVTEDTVQDMELYGFRNRMQIKVQRYLKYLSAKRPTAMINLKNKKSGLSPNFLVQTQGIGIEESLLQISQQDQFAYLNSSFNPTSTRSNNTKTIAQLSLSLQLKKSELTSENSSFNNPWKMQKQYLTQNLKIQDQNIINQKKINEHMNNFNLPASTRYMPSFQGPETKQFQDIMNECDTTQRKLTQLNKKFQKSQVKNQLDFNQLQKLVKDTEKKSYIERLLICFD